MSNTGGPAEPCASVTQSIGRGTCPLPKPIDTRAALLATQIVEGHFESATGSHMHWLYRELSKLMHKDFELSTRQEASSAASSGVGGVKRHRSGKRSHERNEKAST